MFSFLLEPLQYPFMLRGTVAVVLVAALCAVVGTFVVLRGTAFVGEAMRHAIFAGVAISFLLGSNLIAGGLICAVVVAYAIGILGRQDGVGEDTAIGVLFSGAFALGIVLLSWARAGVRDLASILLGNVLGVSNADLVLTATVALLAMLIVGLFFKELVLVSFDPALARSLGRSVAIWDGVLLLLLALALAVAFQTVGNLLVLSLLLAPAATAQLLTRRVLPMMALAVALAVVSGVVGLYVSYWQGVPSGPTIVVLCGALFVLALLFAPGSGAVTALVRRRMH